MVFAGALCIVLCLMSPVRNLFSRGGGGHGGGFHGGGGHGGWGGGHGRSFHGGGHGGMRAGHAHSSRSGYKRTRAGHGGGHHGGHGGGHRGGHHGHHYHHYRHGGCGYWGNYWCGGWGWWGFGFYFYPGWGSFFYPPFGCWYYPWAYSWYNPWGYWYYPTLQFSVYVDSKPDNTVFVDNDSDDDLYYAVYDKRFSGNVYYLYRVDEPRVIVRKKAAKVQLPEKTIKDQEYVVLADKDKGQLGEKIRRDKDGNNIQEDAGIRPIASANSGKSGAKYQRHAPKGVKRVPIKAVELSKGDKKKLDGLRLKAAKEKEELQKQSKEIKEHGKEIKEAAAKRVEKMPKDGSRASQKKALEDALAAIKEEEARETTKAVDAGSESRPESNAQQPRPVILESGDERPESDTPQPRSETRESRDDMQAPIDNTFERGLQPIEAE